MKLHCGALPSVLVQLLQRSWRAYDANLNMPRRRRTDCERGTFRNQDNWIPLRSQMLAFDHRSLLASGQNRFKKHVREALRHRFDCLGSGLIRVEHGVHCQGFDGSRFNLGVPVSADTGGKWLGGRVRPPNSEPSRGIWQLVAADGYNPLDWQLDFKSGYRWSEHTWYREIDTSPVAGADIKLPWELGRMQHLVPMALAYGASRGGDSGFESADIYATEFRNQVLDFVAQNPPRFGVQWACTMDVAIRVSNWLVAYDLFKSSGAEFDDEFEQVLARSVYEHGQHIVRNLEWGTRIRHNHYLANIVGLLFASAYLPQTDETDTWLAFAVEELINEVADQTNSDGSNFEGSICYHGLSSEMVAYATALVLGLPEQRRQALRRVSPLRALRQMGVDAFLVRLHRATSRRPCPLGPMQSEESGAFPFPAWYVKRLERMAEFSMHATKPNGRVVQIGDNDSGRFMKAVVRGESLSVDEARKRYANLSAWSPTEGEDVFWQEDHLCQRHVVAAINALFPRSDFEAFCTEGSAFDPVVSALAGGRNIQESRLSAAERCAGELRQIGDEADLDGLIDGLRQSGEHAIQTTIFDFESSTDSDKPVADGLRTCAYPDFGLYIFRSERLFLSVRCGPVGRRGQGGHDHNDQLSIELSLDGVDWIADPGSYVYTGCPELRNQYRSVNAHFVPCIEGREPAPLDRGLFALLDRTKAETLFFGPEGFAGMHQGYGRPTYRFVMPRNDCIVVMDFIPGAKAQSRDVRFGTTSRPQAPLPFSPGYGIKVSQ